MQVEPPEWPAPFPQWHEWLRRRALRREQTATAAAQHRSFRLRFLFTFWRFFLARNRRLRRAWAAATRHRELLVLWSSLVAFRMFAQMAARERRTRRAVLRHWRTLVRSTRADRQLTLASLMVRSRVLVLRLHAACVLQHARRPAAHARVAHGALARRSCMIW